MKEFSILFLLFLVSCQTSKIDYSNAFWAELEDNQTYLYRVDSLNAIVDYEFEKQTVLLFTQKKGDFYQVRYKPYAKKKKDRKTYWVYKPKFKEVSKYGTKNYENLYFPYPDPNREYLTGERGGCYYLTSNGNKIYVDRSLCNSRKQSSTLSSSSSSSSKKHKTSTYKSSSGTTYVKGHYRTSKSGKRVYVKPHTRSKH